MTSFCNNTNAIVEQVPPPDMEPKPSQQVILSTDQYNALIQTHSRLRQERDLWRVVAYEQIGMQTALQSSHSQIVVKCAVLESEIKTLQDQLTEALRKQVDAEKTISAHLLYDTIINMELVAMKNKLLSQIRQVDKSNSSKKRGHECVIANKDDDDYIQQQRPKRLSSLSIH